MKSMNIQGWESHFNSKGLTMTHKVIYDFEFEDERNPDSRIIEIPIGLSIEVLKNGEKYLVGESIDSTGEEIFPGEFRLATKKSRF